MSFTATLETIAAFNFLLIGISLLVLRNKLRYALFIFGFFLLGKGITLSVDIAFSYYPEMGVSWRRIAYVLHGFLFFYAPFLYFFALALGGKRPSIGTLALHLIPFALFMVYKIASLYFALNGYPYAWIQSGLDFVQQSLPWLYYSQAFVYTFLGYRSLQAAHITESASASVLWVKRALLLFFAIWTFFLLQFAFEAIFEDPIWANAFKIAGILGLLTLANFTWVMTLNNPEAVIADFWKSNAHKKPVNKFITQENYDFLCGIMAKETLYKRPDLSVGDLAELSGFSKRNTSGLIKTYFGQNFPEFVNSYRIAEAKRLLADPESDSSILSILYEAGFNSKSVFNTVFKKQVGLTPTQYKNNQLAKLYS
ncbi:helix-turn-helix transcriptional regulator [Sediminicola luteus]|uniref:HTH araC/xylS-type domain-containing protein n=1 Tax=Sediminicola luteus TaxID=319238 RepID=A0A2A4GEM0_9FLAO|nr:AraC family transcriptional regulator [Sediminicola luteus]PCE66192.1 hypothetical protein B7P33_02525 [Sediminicola luteus]